MKKTILIAGISILGALNTNAQVLYSENFDKLTIGNVGNDVTGQTPGQGGWYTHYSTQNGSSCFQIVNEPSKGKVISFQSAFLNAQANTILKKHDINLLINNRNPNYNIIKLELDFYTGKKYTVPVSSSNLFFGFTDSKNPGLPIAGFNFFPSNGHLKARVSSGVGQS